MGVLQLEVALHEVSFDKTCLKRKGYFSGGAFTNLAKSEILLRGIGNKSREQKYMFRTDVAR